MNRHTCPTVEDFSKFADTDSSRKSHRVQLKFIKTKLVLEGTSIDFLTNKLVFFLFTKMIWVWQTIDNKEDFVWRTLRISPIKPFPAGYFLLQYRFFTSKQN